MSQISRENALRLIRVTIFEFHRDVMIPLNSNIHLYDRERNADAMRLHERFHDFSAAVQDIYSTMSTAMEELEEWDNSKLSQFLNLCRDISELYDLPIHEEMPDGEVLEVGNEEEGGGITWEIEEGEEDITQNDVEIARAEGYRIMNSGTEAGRRFRELHNSQDAVSIKFKNSGKSSISKVGRKSTVKININESDFYDGEDPPVATDLGATLVHEISGHAYRIYQGTEPFHNKDEKEDGVISLFKSEQIAVAMENEYRSFKGLNQRTKYRGKDSLFPMYWDMPIYERQENKWYAYLPIFDDRYRYTAGEKKEFNP